VDPEVWRYVLFDQCILIVLSEIVLEQQLSLVGSLAAGGDLDEGIEELDSVLKLLLHGQDHSLQEQDIWVDYPQLYVKNTTAIDRMIGGIVIPLFYLNQH
jgi:hypothetical protein